MQLQMQQTFNESNLSNAQITQAMNLIWDRLEALSRDTKPPYRSVSTLIREILVHKDELLWMFSFLPQGIPESVVPKR